MFSPAKTDLINEEPDATAFAQLTKVIPLHSNSIDASPDNSGDSEKITVANFCELYSITSDQFLALRRKAARKHPGFDFKPIREGSRTFWVQNAAILAQMIDEGAIDKRPEKNNEVAESVEAEIVEHHDLTDGTALVVRNQPLSFNLPSLDAPNEREVTRIDFSALTQFNQAVEADLQAEQEAKNLTELAQFAIEEAKKQEQKRAVVNLIAKGYTPEQAVQIVTGIN